MPNIKEYIIDHYKDRNILSLGYGIYMDKQMVNNRNTLWKTYLISQAIEQALFRSEFTYIIMEKQYFPL